MGKSSKKKPMTKKEREERKKGEKKNERNNNFRLANTVEEIRQLAEDGWTYFQEIDGVKVFRKPR